jgi:hypothetical protein
MQSSIPIIDWAGKGDNRPTLALREEPTNGKLNTETGRSGYDR